MDDLAHIERILIVPLVEKLEQRFEQMERQWSEFRTDMKQQFSQNEAFLRTITDPVVGYVPRSQIQLNIDAADRDRADLWRAVNENKRDVSRLPLWLITTGIAAAGLAVGIVSLFHH